MQMMYPGTRKPRRAKARRINRLLCRVGIDERFFNDERRRRRIQSGISGPDLSFRAQHT